MRTRGRALRKRVETYYREEQMTEAYAALYTEFLTNSEVREPLSEGEV